MCSIIGHIGRRKAFPFLVSGLEKLEYRGYDSAGIVLYSDDLYVQKDIGKLNEIQFEECDGYNDGVLQNTFNPNTKNTNDFGYWFYHGTSMATPHVSGVAALLIAHGKADANGDGITSPDEVRAALQETAEDLGETGFDETYGWGLVDAPAALQWVTVSEPVAPIPELPTILLFSIGLLTLAGYVVIRREFSY